MANHQTNFTSNFGEMGETGNAAFVLNVNGTSHTYHPVGSDVSVDVATVRRILATAPNLAQSIASVLAAGGYPILAYDGSEYGYIKTVNNRYVFTCLDSLNGVKQAEVDIQDGTITAGTGGVNGVSILARTDSDLFLKITTAITRGRMPIISDTGVYYQLIAKTGTMAQFGRITGTGALEVLTVNNSDQITASSFTFVQDPYYVHTDNNFTNTDKSNVDANTNARHTHTNKSVLDDIEQSNIDDWDNKLNPTGDASNTTSTFTKASGDTSSIASGSKLSAIFTAISSFFASLKALAFKDKASYNDLSSGVQSSLDKADSALQDHQTVTDNNPTLAWGATSKVGTVGSTDLQVTMPSNPAQNLPASVITSGTFGTARIADDAITAGKVKDNETLPVNISGSASQLSHVTSQNEASTWRQIAKLESSDANRVLTQGFVVAVRERINETGYYTGTYIVSCTSKGSDCRILQGTRLANAYDMEFVVAVESDSITLYAKSSSYSPYHVTALFGNPVIAIGSALGSKPTGTDVSKTFLLDTSGQVGDSTTPVYVNPNGQVRPCTPSSMSVSSATTATKSSKSVFYTTENLADYTRYLKIGNIATSGGGQRDCTFLVTTPDGIGDNIPTTYIVTASNRLGGHSVRYARITPEKNINQNLASFGYVVKANNSIDIMMYRPAYSGAINITMIREGDLVADFDGNADGTGYVAGVRYETVMVTQQVGSASTPVYVDSDGQVKPCLLRLPSTIEYVDLSVSSDDLVIEDEHVYVFDFTNSSGGSVVRRLFCTSTTANVHAQIVIRKNGPGTSCCMVDLLYDSAYVNSESTASYNVTSSDRGIVLNLRGRRMTINGVTYDYFEITKQEGYLS